MAKIFKYQTFKEAKKLYGTIEEYRKMLRGHEEARREYQKSLTKLKEVVEVTASGIRRPTGIYIGVSDDE